MGAETGAARALTAACIMIAAILSATPSSAQTAILGGSVTLPALPSLIVQQESINLLITVTAGWKGSVNVSSADSAVLFSQGPGQPFTPSVLVVFAGIRDSMIFRMKPQVVQASNAVDFTVVTGPESAPVGAPYKHTLAFKSTSQADYCNYFNGINTGLYSKTVYDGTVAAAAPGDLKGPYDSVVFSGGAVYCSHRPPEFKIPQ